MPRKDFPRPLQKPLRRIPVAVARNPGQPPQTLDLEPSRRCDPEFMDADALVLKFLVRHTHVRKLENLDLMSRLFKPLCEMLEVVANSAGIGLLGTWIKWGENCNFQSGLAFPKQAVL